MKLFDVFDQWGNRTGEIHYEPPEPPGPSGFGFVLFAVLVLAAVLVWPVLINFVMRGYAKGDEALWLIFYLILYLTSSVLNTLWTVKKETFSFVPAWIRIALINTVMVGGIYWLIGGIMDYFSVSVFISAFLLSFLLSVGSSCICAIIAMLIRKKRFDRGKMKQ